MPRSPVPIVADIHFQYKLALAAMEAGVQALRLNPGNIRKPEHIKLVAREAKDRGLPIRIGVNAGSLDPAMAEQHGGITPEALVASAMHELDLFREVDFDDVKISVKASNVPLMIDAYRLLSETTDHPLHLGVTEAGPMPQGSIKSVAGIATLLAEGIGDTIRFSLTADPVEEAKAGRGAARGARPARAQGPRPHRVPVVRARRGRRDRHRRRRAGRARGAQHPAAGRGDGLRRERSRARRAKPTSASPAGRGKGHLFVKGHVVRVVPEAEMVDALVDEAEQIMAEGIEARHRGRRRRRRGGSRGAPATSCSQIQGTDANHADEKIEKIREIAD